MFLGASDADTEGEWYWMDENDSKLDGSSILWSSGQPDTLDRRDCLVSVPNTMTGTTELHAASCSIERYFLCQRQRKSKQS